MQISCKIPTLQPLAATYHPAHATACQATSLCAKSHVLLPSKVDPYKRAHPQGYVPTQCYPVTSPNTPTLSPAAPHAADNHSRYFEISQLFLWHARESLNTPRLKPALPGELATIVAFPDQKSSEDESCSTLAARDLKSSWKCSTPFSSGAGT